MAKVKVESLVQIQKRKEKEANELIRLNKALNKPEPKGYFWILIVVLSLIYIVDEQASSIITTMQSYIVCNFGGVNYPSLIDMVNKTEGNPYTVALGNLQIVEWIGYGIMLIMPFYKALADKLGRKLFLILNTAIMAVGMLVVMVAPNIPFYIVGIILINLVKSNDVQIMYIMEAAPKKHRAKLCGITKAIALASVSLIGVYRSIFIHQETGAQVSEAWRNVFFIPVVFSLGIALFSIFMTRETPVFLDERIAYLKKSDEERKIEAIEKSKLQGGVGNAFKFIFKHKQLTWIAVVAAIYMGATGFTGNYESISLIGLEDPKMVDTFIIVFPLFNALFTFFNGFIADRFGRRKACISFGIFSFVTFLLWIASMYWFKKSTFTPIFAGAMYGFCIGALWSFSDIVYLTMSAESSPTELRASIMGALSLLAALGGAIGYMVPSVLNALGIPTWISCFCLFVPFMVVSIFIVIFKIGETKDVDMATVTGCEWDTKK